MNLTTIFKSSSSSGLWSALEAALPEPLKGPLAETRAFGSRIGNILSQTFGERSLLYQNRQYPNYAKLRRQLARQRFKATALSFLLFKSDDGRLKPDNLSEYAIEKTEPKELLTKIIHFNEDDFNSLPENIKKALENKLKPYLKEQEKLGKELATDKKYGPEYEDTWEQRYWAGYVLWEINGDNKKDKVPETDEEKHIQRILEYSRIVGQGGTYFRIHLPRLNLVEPQSVNWDIDPTVTSNTFISKIRNAFARMPKAYQQAFEEFGTNIQLTQVLLKRQSDTVDNEIKVDVLGDYLGKGNLVRVPFYYLNGTNKLLLRNTNTEHVFFHELGHRLDYIMDTASLTDGPFFKAYIRDVEDRGNDYELTNILYYVSRKQTPHAGHDQNSDARAEAFAEIFALEMLEKSGYSTLGLTDIRTYFPHTTKRVKDIMNRIENEYRLFPTAGREAILSQPLPPAVSSSTRLRANRLLR